MVRARVSLPPGGVSTTQHEGFHRVKGLTHGGAKVKSTGYPPPDFEQFEPLRTDYQKAMPKAIFPVCVCFHRLAFEVLICGPVPLFRERVGV